MKKFSLIFTILFSLFLGTQVLAQVTLTGKPVATSEVPQVVTDQYASLFSQIAQRWEYYQARGQNQSKEKYVATFKEDANQARARFSVDGKAISYSVYYNVNTLPANIKEAATTKYPNLNILRGQKLKVFKDGKEYYQVILRKGAQKAVFVSDTEGNLVQAPQEMKEAEDAE